MALAALFVFLVGLCVGSFLNVVVLRTAKGEGLGGRSRCPDCAAVLSPAELFPVVSYLVLGGRCRHCQAPISAQYPVVEAVTGFLFVAFFLRYYYGLTLPEGLTAATTLVFLVRDLILTALLLVVFVYDLKYFLILDRFTVPAMIIAFVLNAYLGLSVASMLLGAAVVGGFFFLQLLVSRGAWIGGGDVRMGVLMGLILGFEQALAALFIAYALGAVVGMLLLATRKADLKTQVPFGTFLALATLVMLFCGGAISDWYSARLGLRAPAVQILPITVPDRAF